MEREGEAHQDEQLLGSWAPLQILLVILIGRLQESLIERGLREFLEEANKMTDVITYPFGYSVVLVGKAFAAINDLHEHQVHDELVVGGVSVVVENTLTFSNSIMMH